MSAENKSWQSEDWHLPDVFTLDEVEEQAAKHLGHDKNKRCMKPCVYCTCLYLVRSLRAKRTVAVVVHPGTNVEVETLEPTVYNGWQRPAKAEK